MSLATSLSTTPDASALAWEKFLDASPELHARDRNDGATRAGATFTSSIVPLKGWGIETFFGGEREHVRGLVIPCGGMPSLTHDGIVSLFRNRPELAPELLRDALKVALPTYTEARVESADLTEVEPTEYRADLVVLLVDGKPVFAIVVEVQLELKEADRKFFTWPSYVANLRAHFECDACVLVVTPSEEVAERARRPIHLGPGSTVTPFVVGPKAVPVIVDAEVAKRDPELAVLSAMAHGRDEPELAVRIAVTAESAVAGLSADRALLYSDLIRISFGEAARLAFEALMATGNYQYQSEFHRKHEALARVKGKIEDVLTFLEARGIQVSVEQKERIETCTDLEVLRRWIRKAATIASADELFTD